MKKKRVVVTGIGCITPIGHDKETFYQNLLDGVHGFDHITLYTDPEMKANLAAEVKSFQPNSYLDRKTVKRIDRSVQFALIASQQAVNDAKLDVKEIDSHEFGVIVGTGVGGIDSYFNETRSYIEKGPNYVNPLCVPKFIPNMASGHISMFFKAKGVVNTIVTACAASTHAIGEAFRQIKDGYQDVIIAGGTDACINPVMQAGFVNMNAHTVCDDPESASGPFDENRSGFVLGEGSGFLVMESLEHAQQRNAKIYAEIVGYGNTADAYHLTSPHPHGAGAVRCMENAIKEAAIKCQEIAYVNAHGTGTRLNDSIETKAIKTVFNHDVYVNSTKSMIGHLMGAAGAVEAIATIMSLKHGKLHASIGINHLDHECQLNVIREKTDFHGSYAMSNSFGFGGHNGTLIFKKLEKEG